MTTAVAKNFSVKPLVAAVALAMSAGTALAAPPAGALPGMGVLIAVDVPATTALGSFGLYCMGTAPVCGAVATVGQQIWNGSTAPIFPTTVPSIVLLSAAPGGRAVIQWGGNTYNALTGPNAETANAAGFNVGKSATLVFTANQPNGAILNIDNSGSPSEIFGQLVANDFKGFFTPSLYVANTNGIIVGANATIAVPQGIGLIGASMTGATAINDFVRNNGTGQSFIDVTTGQAKVEVNGSITGDLLNAAPVFNQPATFVLLAGGDVVNTGNVFGQLVEVLAGMRPVASKATVNLVPSTVVNRLWNTDAQFYAITNGTLGAAGGVEIASTSSFVNTGSVSVQGGLGAQMISFTSAGMRSGTQGNTDPSVGIFADGGVVALNYTAGSKVELYNSIKGYSVNNILPSLFINQLFAPPQTQVGGTKGDIVIDALTVGTLPSSITTRSEVILFGDNITINSTINHKLNSAGGFQADDVDLLIGASKNVTINKSIGAGEDVLITANGNILTATGANLLSDAKQGGTGGIFIVNNSNVGGSSTTINGNLDTSTSSKSDIEVVHNGVSTAKVVIAGNVTTHKGGDILVWSDGGIDLSGTFLGSDDVSITALGQSAVIKGPITADVDGPGNGLLAYAAPFAQTKLYPTAVLTAPNVLLGFADNMSPNIQSGLSWLDRHQLDRGRERHRWRLCQGGRQAGGADPHQQPDRAAVRQPERADRRQFGLAAERDPDRRARSHGSARDEPVGHGCRAAVHQHRVEGRRVRRLGPDGDAVLQRWPDQRHGVPGRTARGQRRQFADHQCDRCAERREQQRRAGFDGVDRRSRVPHGYRRERVLRVPGRRGAEVGRSADPVRPDVQRVDRDRTAVSGLLVRGAEDRPAGVLRDPGQRPGERQHGAARWDAQHLRDPSRFAGFVRVRHQVRSRLLQHVLEGDHRHADQQLPDRVRLLIQASTSPHGDRKGRLRAPFF